MPLKAKMRVDKYECLSLKTTHHVWGGVKKKALPWTCASQSAQPRKCWPNRGETVRQARTMRGNPHVPLYAGTRSWVAEPEREKRHQPGKTNQELAIMTMNLRGKK